jgi:hypothetical protein
MVASRTRETFGAVEHPLISTTSGSDIHYSIRTCILLLCTLFEMRIKVSDFYIDNDNYSLHPIRGGD